MRGMKRFCPGCGVKVEGIKTDWSLKDFRQAGHRVATIGTAWTASEQIADAVTFQIAASLAAYDLDYDHELNLGFLGTAWLRCPESREIGTICVAR